MGVPITKTELVNEIKPICKIITEEIIFTGEYAKPASGITKDSKCKHRNNNPST
jgi:hypothetical protein